MLSIILLSASAIFPACGGEADPYAQIDKTLLYGMDEPLWELRGTTGAPQVEGFDLDITVDLLKMLGVKSFRFRIPSGFIQTPTQYNEELYEYLKGAIVKLKEAGVTNLVGQASLFPQYTAFRPEGSACVPRPDDPAYGEWLDALTDLWEAVARLFPEIRLWEMGNEFNSNTFFHPNGYVANSGTLEEGTGGFTGEEQVEVVTDYLYYASKGIKKANPENEAVTPGFAPKNGTLLNVQYFLEDIYLRIESGSAPYGAVKSADPDDYFDVLCWHPYAAKVDSSWLEGNNAVYQVAIDHGDEGKRVIFSEFGFSDGGFDDREALQIEYTEQAFAYCQTEMKYVESVLSFRLYECKYAATWGGSGEIYYGFFREPADGKGFSPKAKATALQAIYGGTGDLTKYE